MLQGFGVAVNARTININKVNVKISDLNFRTTIIGTVVNVLNLYYGLAADFQDLRAKKTALEVAQKFYEDNKKQVQIGTLAPLDVTTAESQVASSQLDLVNSQAALDQQEISLKNALSRTGVNDRVLTNVTVIPVDHIVVPEKDHLPPLRDMVATAISTRPDLEAARENVTTLQLSALGTKNAVLPSLEVFGSAYNSGLSACRGLLPSAPVSSRLLTSTLLAPFRRRLVRSFVELPERKHWRLSGAYRVQSAKPGRPSGG